MCSRIFREPEAAVDPEEVSRLCALIRSALEEPADQIVTGLSPGAPPYAVRLVRAVEAALGPLRRIRADASAERPEPGKWSPREILGHLVDSASNNHQRFVRAQFRDDLRFSGYVQEDWVHVQRHQDRAWEDLIDLWAAFNRHLAWVMAVVDPEIRRRLVADHNLDEIAWRLVPAGTPTSLEYFMADYLGHLEHHLRQVLGPDWSPEAAWRPVVDIR